MLMAKCNTNSLRKMAAEIKVSNQVDKVGENILRNACEFVIEQILKQNFYLQQSKLFLFGKRKLVINYVLYFPQIFYNNNKINK